uniref:Solute carrier family 35 member F1-like n=1 Tax=Hirondellea gigas TaxID=1518452 RepID=A0A6A7G545_9CRUS
MTSTAPNTASDSAIADPTKFPGWLHRRDETFQSTDGSPLSTSVLTLIGWQFLAMVLAGTMIFSTRIAKRASIPVSQSIPHYLILAIVYGSYRAYQKRTFFPLELHIQWWKYLLIAFVDVEANYFVVSAFKYTSITSVSLLGCCSVLFVALLSWQFLGSTFSAVQLVSMCGCLAGLVILVCSDILLAGDEEELVHSWSFIAKGDALVILSSLFYAISNVSQEFVIKTFDLVEFLAMIGILGSILTISQSLILEWTQLEYLLNYASIYDTIWLDLMGFTLAMFVLYSVIPHLLNRSNATVMNLSFLMVDFWAVLASHFLFYNPFHWLRYVAFAVCIVSLMIFHSAKSVQFAKSRLQIVND